MIVVADTSGIIAASDEDAPECASCQTILREASSVVVSPLVLAEVDHIAKRVLGTKVRNSIIEFILARVRRLRFFIPETTPETLETALSVRRRHGDLNLDLADAVNVALAAEFHTDAVLTLDRRDFRAMRPLTSHKVFRVLPDDL